MFWPIEKKIPKDFCHANFSMESQRAISHGTAVFRQTQRRGGGANTIHEVAPGRMEIDAALGIDVVAVMETLVHFGQLLRPIGGERLSFSLSPRSHDA